MRSTATLGGDFAFPEEDEPSRPSRSGDRGSQWIAAARVDPAVFAPLYERHAPAIYRFVHRRVGDPDLADDLTAQIFIRAIRWLDRTSSTWRR